MYALRGELRWVPDDIWAHTIGVIAQSWWSAYTLAAVATYFT